MRCFYFQPPVLRLGRADLCLPDDLLHGSRLLLRTACGEIQRNIEAENRTHYFNLRQPRTAVLFKYTDFFIGTVNGVFGTSIPQLNLPLPIGISFYTFQTMSYTIDVYRGDAKMQKNIISFGAYVSLFPQLIAGPIVRYQDIADQLDERTHSFDKFGDGAKRFVTGLGKRCFLPTTSGFSGAQYPQRKPQASLQSEHGLGSSPLHSRSILIFRLQRQGNRTWKDVRVQFS